MLAVAIPLFTGCALDSERIDGTVPALAGHYRADGARPASAVAQDWFQAFGSSELTSLARQALDGNFDLAAAFARFAQADAQMRIAESALYPQLSGTGDASRSLTPGTLRSKTPPFTSSVGNRFDAGLSASYVLDFWGRNKSLAEAGRLGLAASHFDYDTAAVAMLATLANTYFQVLVAQDRLQIARENIRAAEDVLGAIRGRVEVGTATALDVAQQETVIANLRVNIPILERQMLQQKNLVAVLVGRTPESITIKGGRLRSLALPNVRPGLPAQLLLRRPDIAGNEARLAAAEANIVAARAAFLPNITLTGSGGLSSIALRNLLRADAIALSAAASVTQPIFDGYNLQGQLDAARGSRNELVADYRKSIVTALSDVENALIGVRKYGEQERAQAVAVETARRAYQITQQRLREGIIDVVTLLNTQTTLFSAQDALTLVRYQRLLAIVSLYQALGGGFTREYSDPMIYEGRATPAPMTSSMTSSTTSSAPALSTSLPAAGLPATVLQERP
ncbi:MAG: transporter [Hyphomicrobiales bacterium]|nr:transporter [Hyphomicrobiales bacterium]